MSYAREQVIIPSALFFNKFVHFLFLHIVSRIILHRDVEPRVTADCISRKCAIRTQSNIVTLG